MIIRKLIFELGLLEDIILLKVLKNNEVASKFFLETRQKIFPASYYPGPLMQSKFNPEVASSC